MKKPDLGITQIELDGVEVQKNLFLHNEDVQTTVYSPEK